MGRWVSVIDDDESVRESLPDLLRSFGLEVDAFASAEAFLQSASLERAECLVLDVAMPGMTGPELQRELARQGRRTPIVFVTAQPDPLISAEVLRRDDVVCLLKPFDEAAIVEAVNRMLGEKGT